MLIYPTGHMLGLDWTAGPTWVASASLWVFLSDCLLESLCGEVEVEAIPMEQDVQAN